MDACMVCTDGCDAGMSPLGSLQLLPQTMGRTGYVAFCWSAGLAGALHVGDKTRLCACTQCKALTIALLPFAAAGGIVSAGCMQALSCPLIFPSVEGSKISWLLSSVAHSKAGLESISGAYAEMPGSSSTTTLCDATLKSDTSTALL